MFRDFSAPVDTVTYLCQFVCFTKPFFTSNYTSSEFEPSRCEAQGHMVTALLVDFKGYSLVTVISSNYDSLTALTCQQGLETF